jgi:Rrf2 family protein
MVAIARRRSGLTTSDEIARQEAVSKKYLDSILGRLRKAGLLEATRGSKGGYRLTRAPSAISAAEVIEAVGEGTGLVSCVKDGAACRRAPRCPTREVWCAASEAVRGVLEGMSLGDLARNGRQSLPAGPVEAEGEGPRVEAPMYYI